MASTDDVRREAALKMKAQIIDAVRAAHAVDTGYDQHDPDDGCSQCTTWYRALAVIEEVQP